MCGERVTQTLQGVKKNSMQRPMTSDEWRIHKGSRSRAWQPRPIERFSSVSIPPWPSAIWRLRRESDARPAGFGSEERGEEIRGVGQPGAFVFDRDFEEGVGARQGASAPPPGSSDASTALRMEGGRLRREGDLSQAEIARRLGILAACIAPNCYISGSTIYTKGLFGWHSRLKSARPTLPG